MAESHHFLRENDTVPISVMRKLKKDTLAVEELVFKNAIKGQVRMESIAMN